MATHSGILAWRIPGTEEPDSLTVHRIARVGHNLATKPPPPPRTLRPSPTTGKGLPWRSASVGFGRRGSSLCLAPGPTPCFPAWPWRATSLLYTLSITYFLVRPTHPAPLLHHPPSRPPPHYRPCLQNLEKHSIPW